MAAESVKNEPRRKARGDVKWGAPPLRGAEFTSTPRPTAAGGEGPGFEGMQNTVDY